MTAQEIAFASNLKATDTGKAKAQEEAVALFPEDSQEFLALLQGAKELPHFLSNSSSQFLQAVHKWVGRV
jgi:hypothetical protein